MLMYYLSSDIPGAICLFTMLIMIGHLLPLQSEYGIMCFMYNEVDGHLSNYPWNVCLCINKYITILIEAC